MKRLRTLYHLLRADFLERVRRSGFLLTLGVMLLDDSGNTAQAMAMSLLILVTGLTVRSLFYLLTKGIQARTQAWTQR